MMFINIKYVYLSFVKCDKLICKCEFYICNIYVYNVILCIFYFCKLYLLFFFYKLLH